jgi:predicted transcriptional regulator
MGKKNEIIDKVLMSIKPQYANKIFDGTKRYEFRRSLFKNVWVNTVVVYATAPISRVVGEFKIGGILKHERDALWNKTRAFAGIDKEEYFKYFNDKFWAYAIKVRDPILYKKPLLLSDLNIKCPPQSFMYLRDDKEVKGEFASINVQKM